MCSKFTLAVIGFILLTFLSCKKDNSSGSSNSAIKGQWTFVSMTAKTQSTQQYTELGTSYKTVTFSNYTTTQPSGVVTISDDSIVTRGLAYSVATTAIGYVYEDNQLVDSTEIPFNFTLPPTNSSSKYLSIGKDSLYFQQGGFINMAGSSNPQQSVASGATYVISGNTMTMVMNVNQSSTQTQYGVAVTVTDQGVLTTVLSKQ